MAVISGCMSVMSDSETDPGRVRKLKVEIDQFMITKTETLIRC